MKAVLAQKHAVGGVMYGPGEVEIDEATHATLLRRGAFDHPLTDYPQLIKAGYTSLADARAASDEALLKLEGFGPATLRKLRGEPDEAPAVKPKFIGEQADGAQK
jgi:hypothetical protein